MTFAALLLHAALLVNEPAAEWLSWPAITEQERPWTRWWWLGNAVTEDAITELLTGYKKTGIGGVEITPIYGVEGFEDREIDFLSPEWMRMLAHTTREAKRLGIGVDLNLGTGWPYGGPHIGKEHAAKRMGFDMKRLRPGKPPQKRTPEEALHVLRAFSDDGEIVDLKPHIEEDGAVAWTTPERGRWHVVAGVLAPTGQQVKRAAPGGDGNVMDHFSAEALDQYLARFEAAFADYEAPMPRCVFNDSFEVYGANWTPGLFDTFIEKRGYDLRDHLPALLHKGEEDMVRRVRHDYRWTVAELLMEDFTRPWTAWAHERGMRTRNQAHGSPANLLDLYHAVDIPETEHFGPEGIDRLFWKFASSAAHRDAPGLASAESCTWLGEHFQVTLNEVRRSIDQLFLAGINHVVYHGTPYSPADAPWPGWQFYASTWVAPKNPLWREWPALNTYFARCQAILQRGEAAPGILVYFPMHDHWMTDVAAKNLLQPLSAHGTEDWLHGRPAGRVAEGLLEQGYDFDFISNAQLDSTQNTPVLVPACRYMAVNALKVLRRVAQQGGTVIFERRVPEAIPGLHEQEVRRLELAETVDEALAHPFAQKEKYTVYEVGAGQWIVGLDVPAMLREAGVQREPMVDTGLQYVRRRTPHGYDYFLVNEGDAPFDGYMPVAPEFTAAALLDPMTGETGMADTRAGNVRLQLDRYKSVIVRLRRSMPESEVAWAYYQTTGKPVTIEGPWTLTFREGGPQLPPQRTLEVPQFWTATGGEAAKRFAGTAVYETTFPRPTTHAADAWRLVLDNVGDAASVEVNGEILGPCMGAPWIFDIRDDLLKEANTLAVYVTNTGANRIRYMDRAGIRWKIFKNANVVNIDYKPFDATGWPLRPAGLEGRVRLVPLVRD
ncbi:MAG: glycosyl hydrolase [Candidatus Hydrogenedentota bacterium]